MNWSEIKHFARDEFVCKCGCGRADMDEVFVKKLDLVREYLEFPLRISSGFRCPEHNAAVSSTGRTGPHTTGKAADIAISHQRARKALTTFAHRFNGIGVQQKGTGRFIHIDDLQPRLWSY